MGFFKRMFSADYRAAVAAEAAGDLDLAAERYALAGYREAAVRVHLARADRAQSRADEIAALRDALHWAPDQSDDRRRVARALGHALLAKARAEGVATERDHERVREAAALLLEAGEHRMAGKAYESVGDSQAAARAYRGGGLVELLEQSLARDQAHSDRQRQLEQSFADYEMHLRGGARDAAIEALRRCVAGAPASAEYRRLLDELESRRVGGGRVQLRLRRGQRITLVARDAVTLGRDPLCDVALRSAGVSRRHARIEVSSDQAAGGPALRFSLRDAGSRNGTRVGSLPIDGSVPLEGSGSFDLGDECQVHYTTRADRLVLRIDRGLDQGTLALVAADGPALALEPEGLPAAVRFQDGRPFLLHPDQALTLNGERLAAGDVQLLHGDHIIVGDVDVEVL